MARWFNICAAVLALVAAIFWFLFAYGKLPPMITYWGRTPNTDLFYLAIKSFARMNKWAAGFSGASALCVALGLFIK